MQARTPLLMSLAQAISSCQIPRLPHDHSSQLFSTVSLTRLVYSRRLSLKRLDASTFAGEEVFGSFSKLYVFRVSKSPEFLFLYCEEKTLPLNTGQNSSHIIRRAPSVLQDIQTQLPTPIHIRMEHIADELHSWRLIGILFFEMHYQAERAILEGCVCWTDDYCVPVEKVLGSVRRSKIGVDVILSVPSHYIVCYW